MVPSSAAIYVHPRFRKARAVKTIGMIGGMSWESSTVYYRIVNRNSGLAAEIVGGSPMTGVNVTQATLSGASNQDWLFVLQ